MMSLFHHLFDRTVRRAQQLAPLLLAIVLGLSFAASMSVIVLKYAPASPLHLAGAFAMLSFVVAVILWAGSAFGLTRNPRRLTWVLAAFALVLRVGLLLWADTYPQEADCEFFRNTVEILAAEGFGAETIEKLSRVYYDDYLWIGRALPVFLGLRHLFGEHHVLAAGLFNALLSCLTLFLVYGIGRHILSPRALCVALVCYALLPVHTWLVLDYTHQILGEFLVAAGVWLGLEILRNPKARTAGWFRGGALAMVLILLHLQSGIDYFLVLLLGILAVYAWMERPSWKQIRRPLLYAVVLPLVIYVPPSKAFSHWSDSYQPIRMSSHPVSFTARGWSLETGGEYDGKYEQLDREAPYPRKAETMRSLILSSFYYYPWQATTALPMIKAAKYFLVGYATAIESRLEEAEHPGLAAWFVYSKLFAAPIFLAGALTGCFLLWSRPQKDAAWHWVVAIPLVFFMVYLVLGETSPRYSFHVHFALALLAGLGFTGQPETPRDGSGAEPTRHGVQVSALVGDVAILIALWAALALAIAGSVRLIADAHVFHDMRSVRVAAATDDPGGWSVDTPPSLAAMESWIRVPNPRADGRTSVHVDLPLNPVGEGGSVSVYVWPPDDRANRPATTLAIRINDQLLETMNLAGLPHVLRREYILPGAGQAPATLSLEVAAAPGTDANLAGSSTIRWGYVKVHPPANP